MKSLTIRFEGGTEPTSLRNRWPMATAGNYGVLDLLRDLRATFVCLGLAGLTLSSCASIPSQDSFQAMGMRPSQTAVEPNSADSVVRKTSHARFEVLPAALDTGASILNPLDLRRGQDLMATQPLDNRIVLERFRPGERNSAADLAEAPDTEPRVGAKIQLAAIGTPRIVRGPRRLQCVPFARDASGIQIFGNANRWWDLAEGRYRKANSPQAGSVFVMNGYRTNRRGHVAVVRKVVDSRTMIIDHSNWLNDGKIYLSAPVRDVSENNDWSKVNVWYTPGQAWGSRVYTAKGFIRPNTQVAEAKR
jgi:hypothetical protein